MIRSTKWARATTIATLVTCGCTSPVDRVLAKRASPSTVTKLDAADLQVLESGIARDDVRKVLFAELLTHRHGCGVPRDNDAALVHALSLQPTRVDAPWITAVVQASFGVDPQLFSPIFAPLANLPDTRKAILAAWLDLAPSCKSASPPQRAQAATHALATIDRTGATIKDIDVLAGLLGWQLYARSNGVPDVIEERLATATAKQLANAWMHWFAVVEGVSAADRMHVFLDKGAPIVIAQKVAPSPALLGRIVALANLDEPGVLAVARVFPNAKQLLEKLPVPPGFLAALEPVPYDSVVVETIFGKLADPAAGADDKLRQLAFHRSFELPASHAGDADWLASMGPQVIPKLLPHVDPEDRSRARVASRALARLAPKQLVDKLLPFFDRFEQKNLTPAERAELSVVLAEGLLALRPIADPVADEVFARAAASSEPSLAGWSARLRRERLSAATPDAP